MTNKYYETSINLSATEILRSHEHCTIQPYLSGNYQVDLLLRPHNWAGNINTPTTLTYRLITDSTAAQFTTYNKSFWEAQGKQLALSIGYLRSKFMENHIYERKDPDYLDGIENRIEYQLYENNFESSFAQTEYMLSITFNNIKETIKTHPEHEAVKEYAWIASIDSIYDLDLDKLNIPTENLEDETEELFDGHNSAPSVSQEFSDNKFSKMVQYTFDVMSEVANINFEETDKNEDVSIFARPVASGSTGPINNDKDDYFAIEDFDYSQGKTNHVSLRGMYRVNDKPAFVNMDFAASLHGIGHSIIDHSNDANIAIREYLLPTDYDWSEIETKDFGISNEYRADNGCMSVMAFTKCFYQGQAFSDALTYMPIDIQAMQHIYGKNETTRSGDTTYILTESQTFIDDTKKPFFPMDIPANSIYTLYDAGGNNTLDLSLVKQAKIDLNEGAGHFNAVGNNIFLIAYGTHIHNVIVGSGDIEIKLNPELNNSITIPASGAHVTIENFTGKDSIILVGNDDQNLEFTGCVQPYANMGDNQTEICFV